MACRFSALSLTLGLLLAVGTAADGVCPGSPAWVHASMKVKAIAKASCKTVMDEMTARVQGQFQKWHDPHNNGTYTLLSSHDSSLALQRVTGNKKFTDKMGFGFLDQGSDQCIISGCSESQSTSIADFSTNYCNLRNLYCGSKEGCKSVMSDFDIQEVDVAPSVGAGKDASACIVKQNKEMEMRLLGVGKDVDPDTAAALGCVTANCPMDNETLAPSALCVLENCATKVGKCVLGSVCRGALMCEEECTAPLKKTDDAPKFLAVTQCLRERCPGFPPSTSCAVLHCGVAAGECALHSKCRQALECANGCVPAGAALTAALLLQNEPLSI